MFVKATRYEIKFRVLVLLALISEFPDLSHLAGDLSLLHNIFVFIPLLGIYIHQRRKENTKIYVVILMLMVYGHLLSDMIFGMGIPLFYPLSDKMYLLPQIGLCMYDSTLPKIMYGPDLVECFFTTHGLALALYFGVIGGLSVCLSRR